MKVDEKIKTLKRKQVLLLIGGVIISAALLFLINIFCVWKYTREYNEIARKYNQLAEEYEDLLKLSCIDNIVGIPPSYGMIEIVDENMDECFKVIFGKNSSIKIWRDTKTLLKLCDEIKIMSTVIEQITAPDALCIEKKICEISDISATELVTEEQNPDALLNEEGGYIGCIYFSLKEIDQTKVPGNTIVEKGTDCGGAIEIYATLEEAEARCEYLSGFDGSILYSGSYAIVGTTVIRTSYMLPNERQWEVTSAITKKMTEVNDD